MGHWSVGAILLLTLTIMHAIDMLAVWWTTRQLGGRQVAGSVLLVVVVTGRIIQRTMEGTL